MKWLVRNHDLLISEDLAAHVIKPISHRLTTDGGSRIETAYFDFTTIVLVAKEYGERSPGDPFSLRGHERATWMSMHNRRQALLKAAYVLADVFISVMCNELIGRGPRGKGLKGRLRTASVLWELPQESLTKAYALSQYRNSIIVHHDYARVPASLAREGELRLYLQGFGLNMDSLANPIRELCSRYNVAGDAAVDMPGKVSTLFEMVPPIVNGKWNPDRSMVDRLADQLGCRSMTVDELVLTVDHFATDLAAAVRHGNP